MSAEDSIEIDSEEQVIDEDALPFDHWLHKMDGYLDWRVLAPQIHNPFEMAIPDRMLIMMSKNRDVVRKHVRVRCLCDGHEVLSVDNLSHPIIFTQHPCLVGINRRNLLHYFVEEGVDTKIEEAIDRVQEEVREELKKREIGRPKSADSEKSMAQIKAEKAAKQRKEPKKPESTGSPLRVIRR
jgi:hypothetical protein